MKKILFVTSKHPFASDSKDGGDATVSEFIRALGAHCQLDILCFRECDSNVKIPLVHKKFFQNMDFANYDFYSKENGEKFLVRLKQADVSAKKIISLSENYDIIIVQHCMFILKLADFSISVFQKIILLPMFTGIEYLRSQEHVPPEYILAEKIALGHVQKIITPSNAEREILISDYKISPEKIFVIPRSVTAVDVKIPRSCNEKLQLVYIASVRRQKAHLEAMELFARINEIIPNAQFHCVGTIQDKNLFGECVKFLQARNLANDVFFHGTLSQKELHHLLSLCDVNISVSFWESFGRSIFEGMAMGLPTVILERILSVVDIPETIRPLTASCLEEMVTIILNLYTDEKFFRAQSLKSRFIRECLAFERIQRNLRNTILLN